jgi:hypothetical protein
VAFRKVRVFEVREALRLWVRGGGLRFIERLTTLDGKTVRRDVEAAAEAGVVQGGGEDQLTDDGVDTSPPAAWTVVPFRSGQPGRIPAVVATAR